MSEWSKWEKETLDSYKEQEPKFCLQCGKKLLDGEVSAYVGDRGFNECGQRIYYSISCSVCNDYTEILGPDV